MTVGPGDRLGCIKPDGFAGARIVPGEVYTVARMRDVRGWDCEVCFAPELVAFDLAEFPTSGVWAWCSCCFRPTWETDEEFLKATRTPMGQHVEKVRADQVRRLREAARKLTEAGR